MNCILTVVCAALVLLSHTLQLSAQVQNNSFKDRIHLTLDSPLLASTTARNTVEWECVNKALTNKCLVYHNDQWFYFIMNKPGSYFLNITGQKCRDKRGIQVLIIEGNPCETSDYRILECVSQGLQNDVFISLKSLKQNVPYLINIDGFLGDYCDFDIQVASKPLGLPLRNDQRESFPVEAIQSRRQVEIRWTVPKERIELYRSFTIYKKKSRDIRSSLYREMTLERNTYGEPTLQYSFIDTLRSEGIYTFSIFGIQKETMIPILVSENTVNYFEKKTEPTLQSVIIIPIQNSSSANFEVMVYDPINSSTLTTYKAYLDLQAERKLEVDLSRFISKGMKSFMVRLSDLTTGESKEYYYQQDKAGRLIKQ